MTLNDDNKTPTTELTARQRLDQRQEAYKKIQREKAKAAREAYQNKPEVKERLEARKRDLAAQRKKKAAAAKAARKEQNRALADASRKTKENRQKQRDQELVSMLDRASALEQADRPVSAQKPILTLIKGGLSERP
jgi:hypothetical protein